MINDFQQKDTHYSKQLKAHYGPYLGTFSWDIPMNTI